MVKIENLIRLATLVRDETANKQNTALRVGGTFLEVVYAIRYLLETVGELDTLAKGLDTRTRFFHGSFADVDALKNKTDLGVYVAITTGWTGLLSVQFDFYSTVSQVALSSSTPDYSEGSLAWKPAPCVMFRTYTDGTWSAWRKAGADVVNDLVTGGIDRALSAEQGKVLDQMVADLRRIIEGGSVSIGTIETLKSLYSDGTIHDSTAAGNRTLVADVSNYVNNNIIIGGSLFKRSTNYDYCWWAIHDADGNVLTKSNTSGSDTTHYTDVSILIPANAKTLYVQGSSISGYVMPYAMVTTSEGLKQKVSTLSGWVEKLSRLIPQPSTRTFPLDYPTLGANSGKIYTSTTWNNKYCSHTPDYLKVHNTITIKNLGGTTLIVRVFFYDTNLAMISSLRYQDTENGLNTIEVADIPTTAVWFRVAFMCANTDVATMVGYSRQDVDVESEWGDDKATIKEPYVEYNPFIYPVKVNMPMKIADNPSIITKTIFAYDEGLIHLPPTYTPNGKPTPVIFYIHGDAERYVVGESTFSGHMKMQQCWSDAGFAQVDLDLIPSCFNESTMSATGGVRNDLECLSAAWEWITNHFNIDKRGFYLIGRSRGGQCVFEVLGKGGASKLPIIAAISMAGANSIFEYSVYSVANEAEWQLWCNAHGLPTSGRPTWGRSDNTKSFLSKTECYNFVVANWDLWWRKALTGWGLITKNSDNITPRDYFDNYIYPYVQNNRTYTAAIEEFFEQMVDTMEAKSPIPLRLDWCVGDKTQTNEYFVSPHSYSSVFAEILLNTPASLTEYRRWDGVDASNPYKETDPHFAENMIFYSGNLTLPNGKVTSNPSKVAMEWLVWCMGKDARYQGMDYTLPWQ